MATRAANSEDSQALPAHLSASATTGQLSHAQGLPPMHTRTPRPDAPPYRRDDGAAQRCGAVCACRPVGLRDVCHWAQDNSGTSRGQAEDKPRTTAGQKRTDAIVCRVARHASRASVRGRLCAQRLIAPTPRSSVCPLGARAMDGLASSPARPLI